MFLGAFGIFLGEKNPSRRSKGGEFFYLRDEVLRYEELGARAKG